MSGLVGILSLNKPLDQDLLNSATSTLKHRGPDDEGYLLVNTNNLTLEEKSGDDTISEIRLSRINERDGKDYNFGLGHRRLAVIDLSYKGHQPMSYDNGNLWIAYDGGVYNYKELKQELQNKGYAFRSNTDTEVILASYREWGYDCVNYFNGDWAFCIYDKKKNILFLSRDRFGVKFLYYYWDGKIFAFASEIKALFLFPDIQRQPNSEMIYQYLAFSLLDHSNQTMYKNIYQIEPGHNLIFDLNTKKIDYTRYYELKYNPELGRYNQRKALGYADDIRNLLIDSVRLRLRADVPIGASLSGGLDSSSIAVIINKLCKEEGISKAQIGDRQRNFTISSPCGASRYAPLINNYINAQGYFIYPDKEGFVKNIGKLLYYMDELFGAQTIHYFYQLMQEAGKYVKVILNGDGAEGIFGGDKLSNISYLAQLMKEAKIINFLSEVLCIFKMNDFILKKLMLELKGFSRFLFMSYGKKNTLLIRNKSTLIKNAKKCLNLEYATIPSDITAYYKTLYKPKLNQVLYLALTRYPLPKMLHNIDRISMASSIEPRLPYLDYRLVDYVFNIPARYKFRNGLEKWILRLAMKNLLPEEVLLRRKSMVAIPSKERIDGKDFRFFLFRNSHFYKQVPFRDSVAENIL